MAQELANEFHETEARKVRLKAKLDEVVQTPAARLSGRTATRATDAYGVRAAEIVLTH